MNRTLPMFLVVLTGCTAAHPPVQSSGISGQLPGPDSASSHAQQILPPTINSNQIDSTLIIAPDHFVAVTNMVPVPLAQLSRLMAMQPAAVILPNGPTNAAGSNFQARAEAACPGCTKGLTNYTIAAMAQAWAVKCPESYYHFQTNLFFHLETNDITGFFWSRYTPPTNVSIVWQGSPDMVHWVADGVQHGSNFLELNTNHQRFMRATWPARTN